MFKFFDFKMSARLCTGQLKFLKMIYNYYVSSYSVLCILLLSFELATSTEVTRPRGVALEKRVFYDPLQDFTCIDGSLSVPFTLVNDDYCDCPDGSDEPGTAACPEGKFWCLNLGHTPLEIPSSRVNDGICDCCDGSDEYNSTKSCQNTCDELGAAARAEAKRLEELRTLGLQKKQELIQESQQKLAETKEKLEQLKQQLDALKAEREEKEAIKKGAEERENGALQKYREVEEEEKKKKEEEEVKQYQQEEERQAKEAFKELDLNNDGILRYEELQKNVIFDQNKDGEVSADEAKFFLHMAEEMKEDEFVTTGWMIMKPIYNMGKEVPAPPIDESHVDVTAPPPPVENEEDHPMDEPEYREDDDDLDEEKPPEFPPKEEEHHGDDGEATPLDKPAADEDLSKYDDETRALIQAAKKSRDEFDEVDRKFNDIQRDIRQMEDFVSSDYGSDHAFATMKGQCFEYTDREYTYKLCMFDRASQRPRDGGHETSLGRWGRWSGEEGDRYSRQKYEGGASCWNGPNRSVDVIIECDLTHVLKAASEPSRCEYQFVFGTPAACGQSDSGSSDQGDGEAEKSHQPEHSEL